MPLFGTLIALAANEIVMDAAAKALPPGAAIGIPTPNLTVGTYVVPKVIDQGYLALGKERVSFSQQGR